MGRKVKAGGGGGGGGVDRAQAEPGVKSHKGLVGTSAARPLRTGHGPKLS